MNFPVIGPLSGSLGLKGFLGSLIGVSPLDNLTLVLFAPLIMFSRPASEFATLLSSLLLLGPLGSKSPKGTSAVVDGASPEENLLPVSPDDILFLSAST